MATATAKRGGTRGRPAVKGVPTKHPSAADAKSLRQPPKGQKPTKAQVKKAREAWGIEPFAEQSGIEVIRPASRSRITHARVPRSSTTLCLMDTTKWVGGVSVVEDHDELDCLWCMTRIEA